MHKVFLLLAIFASTTLMAAEAYAGLGSSVTQLPSAVGGSKVVLGSVTSIKNIDLTDDKTTVLIKEAGIYFIMAGGQAGASNPGASGYVDMWLVHNDKPVPNSSTRFGFEVSSQTGTLTYNLLMPLYPGDTLATQFTASGPSLGFIAMQPDNEPSIPSFEFIVFKLAEVK